MQHSCLREIRKENVCPIKGRHPGFSKSEDNKTVEIQQVVGQAMFDRVMTTLGSHCE
jgi:hypothetical protein